MAKGLKKKMYFSDELETITGRSSGARTDATKWFWDYVKKHDLQDPNDGRIILAGEDDDLYALCGKNKVKMTEVGGILSKHLFDE